MLTRTRLLVAPFAAAAIALAFATPVVAAPRAHASWCKQQYRSYNPASDTFVGYDGRTHRCMSPQAPATRSFGLAPAPRSASPQAANSNSGHRYSVFPDQNDPNYGNPFGGPT
jgi:hypothetical protein